MITSLSSGLPGVTITPGDHICAFYRGSAQRDDVLLPYLREAIAAGDKCICVMDDPDTDVLVGQLAAQVDVTPARHSGQFDLMSSEDTYLAGGYFATDEMIGFWEHRVGAAVGAGYGFVRAVGEMTWALRDLPGVALLLSYEARLNHFLPRYPQVVLCLYDLERFSDGNVLLDLMRTHPKVLLSGQIMDNPWYMDPDDYLATLP